MWCPRELTTEHLTEASLQLEEPLHGSARLQLEEPLLGSTSFQLQDCYLIGLDLWIPTKKIHISVSELTEKYRKNDTIGKLHAGRHGGLHPDQNLVLCPFFDPSALSCLSLFDLQLQKPLKMAKNAKIIIFCTISGGLQGP